MAVSTIGRAPYQAYARESDRARSPSPTARVVTTEVGFQLGRFGLSYTSQDVELLSNAPGRSAAGLSLCESFEAALDGAAALSRMFDAAATSRNDIGDHPLASRQRAVAAYAAAQAGTAATSLPRTLLATV